MAVGLQTWTIRGATITGRMMTLGQAARQGAGEDFRALQARVARKLKIAAQDFQTVSQQLNLESIFAEVNQLIERKQIMQEVIARRFRAEAEHGPGSTKWKPLSAKYRRWKLSKGFSRHILVRTGQMMGRATGMARSAYKLPNHPVLPSVESLGVPWAKYAETEGRVLRPFYQPLSAEEKEWVDAKVMPLLRSVIRKHVGALKQADKIRVETA